MSRPFFVLPMLLAACGGVAPAVPVAAPPVVRDSAGVRIVENAAPQWRAGDEWTVDTAPSVVIRARPEGDARYEMTGIREAVRLPDGRYLIAAEQSQEILLFDRADDYIRTIGKIGDGPGEYHGIAGLVLLGDSILVGSAHFGSINLFDTLGYVLRTLPPLGARVSRITGPGRYSEGRRFLPDGSFVVEVNQGDAAFRALPPHALGRPPIGYYRVRRDGTVDSLGWYAGSPQRRTSREADIEMAFYDRTHLDSYLAAGSHPFNMYVTMGDRADVDVYDAEGKRVRIVRNLLPDAPMPDSLVRKLDDRFLAGAATPALRSERERIVAALPPAGSVRYERALAMLVDSEGFLWVQGAGPTYGGWQVYDPEGRWLGRVHLPFGRVLAIGRDHLTVLRTDGEMLESVLEFPLRRLVPSP